MQATRFGGTLLTIMMLVAGAVSARQATNPSVKQDLKGIERLHEQDKEATLADSADQLAKLWDKDAVRFHAERPAEIGAAVIYADDKQWEMSSGRERSLCGDLEVQDIQIAGDWAFEWGYFSYKVADPAGKISIQYGKLLRVMKRQSDGTWRFARVMGLPDTSASAVVLSHPCRLAPTTSIEVIKRWPPNSTLPASHPSVEQDMKAIERLHEQDKEATLSDSADQLAKLWDKDAVRFLVDRPAEIGAAMIYADDKQWEMSSGRERTLCYDIEVQDIQIAGDWAFEWGYVSGKSAKGDKVSVKYGQVTRVMKRQYDGTWRFARVMGLLAPSASSVMLKHPCQ
jgi:ketosteroid isomerase-like protein